MSWKNLIELDLSNIKTVVKVDDTLVGIEGLAGGLNPYAYALNNPVMYVDMTGENPILIAMGCRGWRYILYGRNFYWGCI